MIANNHELPGAKRTGDTLLIWDNNTGKHYSITLDIRDGIEIIFVETPDDIEIKIT